VGDGVRKLLAGVVEMTLGFEPRRDVAYDDDDPCRVGVFDPLDARGLDRDPVACGVRYPQDHWVGRRYGLTNAGSELAEGGVEVIGMDQLQHGLAEPLLIGIAECPPHSFVGEADHSLVVDDDDNVGGCGEHSGKQL
jgi:hypothetical protein